jgi:hypothetical protein
VPDSIVTAVPGAIIAPPLCPKASAQNTPDKAIILMNKFFIFF